jgi:hypothetical protein
MSPNNKLWVSQHREQAVNQEVHVVGWGDSFFTVVSIEKDDVYLRTRHQKYHKYVVNISRCYFTNKSGRQVSKESIQRQNG